jgi:hypothetical protein
MAGDPASAWAKAELIVLTMHAPERAAMRACHGRMLSSLLTVLPASFLPELAS